MTHDTCSAPKTSYATAWESDPGSAHWRFFGDPAPAAQRPQRRLFERFSASFVFAAKRGGAGSKNVQRAEGSRFPEITEHFEHADRMP